MSDAVWLAVIGLATMCLKELFDHLRARRAAVKVEEVKASLQERTKQQDAKLDSVAAKIEEVHKATNSMKDELVKKTEEEALARGGHEERARAESRKEGKGL